MSVITLVEKPARDMENVNPGETPKPHSCLIPSSLHSSKSRLPPSSQPRGRFLRDLRRRPVLVWTAHFAKAAAAPPGMSPAPPGGE